MIIAAVGGALSIILALFIVFVALALIQEIRKAWASYKADDEIKEITKKIHESYRRLHADKNN